NLVAAQTRARRTSHRLNAWVLAAVLLVLWEVASRAHWLEVIFFPAPGSIAENLFNMLFRGKPRAHLGPTLARVGTALARGATAGMVLGGRMGWDGALRATLGRFVAAIHPLPKLALFPLFLVVLGIGDTSMIAVISVSVLFPVLINTQAGVAQIDSHHWDVL